MMDKSELENVETNIAKARKSAISRNCIRIAKSPIASNPPPAAATIARYATASAMLVRKMTRHKPKNFPERNCARETGFARIK